MKHKHLEAQRKQDFIDIMRDILESVEKDEIHIDMYSIESETIFPATVPQIRGLRHGPYWKLTIELFDTRREPASDTEYSGWTKQY